MTSHLLNVFVIVIFPSSLFLKGIDVPMHHFTEVRDVGLNVFKRLRPEILRREFSRAVIVILPIVGAVDHGTGNVLVHEEQQRQTESQSHSS
jgi:hypothetical protein